MKEYLPLGTVVLLTGGVKPIMIYGRKQLSVDNGQEFDYVACLYPEGNINDDFTFLFNADQIEKVLFVGYKTPEDDAFIKALNEDD